MNHSHYLLIIDPNPLDEQLIDYFAKFNLSILHQEYLSPIQLKENLPTAILLEWSLLTNTPQTISQLYDKYPVPILIISAQANEDSCISVLEAGADDYLIKPLYPRELHARINAISRRVMKARQKAQQEKEVFAFNNWRLYPASRQVFDTHHKELLLSTGEYELLLIFLQQPQKILNREFLLYITKNSDHNPLDRRIDVQISRLRQKIEVDKKKPALIKTIRNGGYMFTAPVITLKESEIIGL